VISVLPDSAQWSPGSRFRVRRPLAVPVSPRRDKMDGDATKSQQITLMTPVISLAGPGLQKVGYFEKSDEANDDGSVTSEIAIVAPSRRRVWALCSALGIAALALLAPRAVGRATPPLAPVGDAPPAAASAAALVAKPRIAGRIELGHAVALASRVSGTVAQVHVREGATVREGEVLLTIDSTPLLLEIEYLSAKIREAEAELRLIRRRKFDPVFDERVGRAVDDEIKLAEARLASTTSAYRRARGQLRDTKLVAPFAGQILSRSVHPGESVAGSGHLAVGVQPLLVLAKADDLHVRVEIDTDNDALALGEHVEMRTAPSMERTLTGQVVLLTASTARSGHLNAMIVFDPGQALSDLPPGREVLVERESARGVAAVASAP
jgi:hypothetical protein